MSKKNLKILFAAILIACVFTRDKICEHLGIGLQNFKEEIQVTNASEPSPPTDRAFEENYAINDTIYRWDEQLSDYVVSKRNHDSQAQLVNNITPPPSTSSPIEIDWKVLMDIDFKLRYFEEIEMDLYAPVFSKAVEALHGKEIIIEGFVIPLDQKGDLMPLSCNPYASCFFCGKASPASIISMYLKKKRKRYKLDDFKKFRGTLYLNHDDPNEFCYILRDAIEE